MVKILVAVETISGITFFGNFIFIPLWKPLDTNILENVLLFYFSKFFSKLSADILPSLERV